MSYMEGKIIIVDMPIMEWKAVGKLAQGLFKYMFQRAIERRSMKAHSRPVFIWADEAQYFLNRNDMMFLTTARSSGCATVSLCRNAAGTVQKRALRATLCWPGRFVASGCVGRALNIRSGPAGADLLTTL